MGERRGEKRAKRIILDYFFAHDFGVRYHEMANETRGQRGNGDVELAELNTAHKLRTRRTLREVRRTAGRNLISLANEFLSKSRVSRLM